MTSACPEIRRIVLVESGSRSVLEAAIPRMRAAFGAQTQYDLITCLPEAPSTLEAGARTWRTQDYRSRKERALLLRELENTGITVLAIVCSGESIMMRWKWWLAWNMPAKILVINENADCFWLDTANLRTLRRMLIVRAGLSGGIARRTLVHLALLPFLLLYLLGYATMVHTRRAIRLAFAHPK